MDKRPQCRENLPSASIAPQYQACDEDDSEVKANLVKLNEEYALPYVPELIARKLEGGEKGYLNDADPTFHEKEYERLCARLEDDAKRSSLPEKPAARDRLNDLLLRLRRRSF